MKRLRRAVIETGFIIFLFYTNLLMGQFTRSNSVDGKSLFFAIGNIFTITNFVIGVICALIAYLVVEYLRRNSRLSKLYHYPAYISLHLLGFKGCLMASASFSHSAAISR